MSQLKRIQDAQSLTDLAHILGYKPQAVSFLLYILPDSEKYTTFVIQKRNGGVRVINAPVPKLKKLQKHLARLLTRCITEIHGNPPKSLLAHGFLRSRSIYTNASLHKNRRYVLNLDLKDFFPSINFGRVRGFFIRDQKFCLNENVATVIAQIVCHNNELPQGSPSSPIISNLIGHILDVRLVEFLKNSGCTYSRYADDITISTNKIKFPINVAIPQEENPEEWKLSLALVDEIKRVGFEINTCKTRMQYRGSRQIATGLVVNKKVNIRNEYYRKARAICHRLFTTGSYFLSEPTETQKNLRKIEGILSFIYQIKDRSDSVSKPESNKSRKYDLSRPAILELYKKFLIYKHFVSLDKPIILTEGKTDQVYLRLAIKRLRKYHPCLGEFTNGIFHYAVGFLNHTETVKKVLNLGGGTGNLSQFVSQYKKNTGSFKHRPFEFPVILLIDNDDGATPIFATVKENLKKEVSHVTTDLFYHLCTNLYLVKTPEIGPCSLSKIEDLFSPRILSTKIGSKSFNLSNEDPSDQFFGKNVFAQKVVKPLANERDFLGFETLLDRILAVMSDYEKNAPGY